MGIEQIIETRVLVTDLICLPKIEIRGYLGCFKHILFRLLSRKYQLLHFLLIILLIYCPKITSRFRIQGIFLELVVMLKFCHRVNTTKESTTNNYFSRLKAKTNTRLNICRIFFKGSLLINTYVRVDQDRFSVVWCVATTVYVAKALIICFLYFLNYRLDQNEL